MRRTTIVLTFILFATIFTACDQDSDIANHQMSDEQMEQIMQNHDMRQMMMQRMAGDPVMRNEMMAQMRAGMGQMGQEAMLDRMESMMQNPERRQQMLAHMQAMQTMLESDEFDRDQMRQMIQDSPMMGMQMRCMQMMNSGMMLSQDSTNNQGMMNHN